MRCSKCGYENPNTNKFCAGCGAPLPAVIQNQPNQPLIQNVQQPPHQNVQQPPYANRVNPQQGNFQNPVQPNRPQPNFPQGNYPNQMPQNPNNGKKVAIIIASIVGGLLLLIIISALLALTIPSPRYDDDTTRTTYESTTETTTKNDAVTIGEAYSTIIDSYIESKGGYKETSEYPEGVVYVDHIDFDNDGTDELFIVYNNSSFGKDYYCYEVWTYMNESVMKIRDESSLLSISYDGVVTITFVNEYSTGRVFLHQDYKDSDGLYYRGDWQSKVGNEFKYTNTAWFASNYADVGDKSYTYQEFDKYWETYNVKIGNGESSEYTLKAEIDEIKNLK